MHQIWVFALLVCSVLTRIKAQGLMFEHKRTVTYKRTGVVAKQSSSEHIWFIQFISIQTVCTKYNSFCCLKGNSHQKVSVTNMIELLLKKFLVYHSPMFEAWKVPKRPVEVLCDVTEHLVAYWTAVETRTIFRNVYTYRITLLAALHAYTDVCLTSCM